VAHAVGLNGATCPAGSIPDDVQPDAFAVFAGVLPEDKYKLVKAFQHNDRTVGMCGDGANDAPALRQAQIGIAVSTATDVAKSAAGMVLTEAGLAGIVAAVKEGRITYQRILTYTLNSIIKKVVTVLFLVIGLVMTGHAVLTPRPCCTDQGCGRNCSSLVWGQATRTEIGRPSSSMRLSAWTATSTSVARRRSVRERSPSPITCLNRPIAASARARFV